MAKRRRDGCGLPASEPLRRAGGGFVVRDLPWTVEKLRVIPPFEFDSRGQCPRWPPKQGAGGRYGVDDPVGNPRRAHRKEAGVNRDSAFDWFFIG